MCWHMRDLHLWEFLTGELPCLPCPTIPEKATNEEMDKLLADFDDLATSYASQFSAHQI